MDKSLSNACCKDVYKQIGIKNTHPPANTSYDLLNYSEYTIALANILSLLDATPKENVEILLTHSPPPPATLHLKLNISHCVFLI
jgi:hypothetical protein